MNVLKVDEELQVVYGEVYAPDVPDSQGDFMSAENIRKMAHKFLENLRQMQIDTNHNNLAIKATVVESFIAREGDSVFIPGSWVVGVHVEDPDIWAGIKDGTFNGFSFEGAVRGQVVELEMEIPEHVLGETDTAQDHSHKFKVSYDKNGNFLGGETDEVAGHTHRIVKGTVTEEALGHTHRFSVVEAFING